MGEAFVRQGLFGLLMHAATRPNTLANGPRCVSYSASSGKRVRAKNWSKEENEKIQELARKHTSLLNVENLEAEYPGRTYREILNKFSNTRTKFGLNLGFDKRRLFSCEEDRLLTEAKVAGRSWAYVSGLFPDRASRMGSLKKRWQRLCRREPKHWSSQEADELLRLRHDLSLTWAEIAMKLKRDPQHVKMYYKKKVPPEKRVGLTDVPKWRHWTQEEYKTLASMRTRGKSFQEIGEALDRSEQSIFVQYYRPTNRSVGKLLSGGYRHWTEDETSRLKVAYKDGKATVAQLKSQFPGRTMRSIRLKLMELGFGAVLRSIKWTSAEVAVLETAIQQGLKVNQIMPQLPGRTYAAIRDKKASLVKAGLHLRS
jgi:hypothetical protein